MQASKAALLGNMAADKEYWDDDETESSDESGSEDREPKRAGASVDSAIATEAAPKFAPAPIALEQPAVISAVAGPQSFGENSALTMALIKAIGLRSGMPALQVTDGARVQFVKLAFSGSLADLENGKVKPILVCSNPNMAALFGNKQVSVLEISALGYDNDFKVNFGIMASEKLMPNAATHNLVTSGGAFLFEAKRRAGTEFDVPKKLFECQESDFKKQMAKHYPGINETNVAASCMPSPVAGMMLVPFDSAILPAAKKLISKAKADAQLKGEVYSGTELTAIHDVNAYQLEKELVTRAANITAQSFIETADSLDITKDLALHFGRTDLSDANIAKAGSKASAKWTDPTHLLQSLKTGNTLDKEVARIGTLTVTCAVKYIPSD